MARSFVKTNKNPLAGAREKGQLSFILGINRKLVIMQTSKGEFKNFRIFVTGRCGCPPISLECKWKNLEFLLSNPFNLNIWWSGIYDIEERRSEATSVSYFVLPTISGKRGRTMNLSFWPKFNKKVKLSYLDFNFINRILILITNGTDLLSIIFFDYYIPTNNEKLL